MKNVTMISRRSFLKAAMAASAVSALAFTGCGGSASSTVAASSTASSAAAEDGTIRACSGWTDIFIYPGSQFKILDCLITNFHLPESTLVMLVSALAGREHVLTAYEEAIRQRYRFFSFGDAMFIQ